MRAILVLLGLGIVGISHAQGTCSAPPEPKSIVALPAGTIIEGVGSTDLPITTASEQARKLTKQGFALIHCFWFNESVRSFRDATKEDPSCAIAWMGLNAALTLPWHRPRDMAEEADYAIKRAVQLCGEASDAEQALIAAYRLRSASRDDRESEFELALDRMVQDHPELNEPRLLLAGIRAQLCMNDDYDSNFDPTTEMPKVLKLIAPVLERDPTNAGALHYRIHALEGNQPLEAVKAAELLGNSAPASSHMVHMPGHIFNRVGMYDRARAAFDASSRVDEIYATKIPGATPNVNWNYSHNVDFAIFNLIEMGRLREAEEMAKKNPWSRAKIWQRTGNWSQLPQGTAFFAGMAAVAQKDLSKADEEARKLEEAVKRAANARGRGITRARMDESQALELRGAILSAQDRHEEAIAALSKSVEVFEKIGYSEPPYVIRPPYETLGEALIRAGRFDEAAVAFERGLRERPESGWMLYGIALAKEKSGRMDDARLAYERFLKAWSGADDDLASVKHAKEFLATHSR